MRVTDADLAITWAWENPRLRGGHRLPQRQTLAAYRRERVHKRVLRHRHRDCRQLREGGTPGLGLLDGRPPDAAHLRQADRARIRAPTEEQFSQFSARTAISFLEKDATDPNKKKPPKGGCCIWSRGLDLNQRPPGYERTRVRFMANLAVQALHRRSPDLWFFQSGSSDCSAVSSFPSSVWWSFGGHFGGHNGGHGRLWKTEGTELREWISTTRPDR